eukprot:TRINITY_DN4705_c0_g1_i2.p1 TRINITY_DN4705_c0_g1~~TRINITY_DN4705_c0_g1_i2.p1  ORF type:complete len:286 (+),score=45.11 TRINITY_DN4705_c0_g1_i2:44-901(+)
MNFTEDDLLECIGVLRKRIVTHRTVVNEHSKLRSVFEEGGSALVIGPKGSGKTAHLVKTIESVEEPIKIISIKTSGLYSLVSAKLFQDLARQIQAQTDRQPSPEEQKAYESFVINDIEAKKLLETDIFHALHEFSDVLRVQIAIIIEDIDNYTSNIERQNFLYSILELTTQNPGRVAVVCLSSCPKIESSLEKRVRSRLSAQIIRINPPQQISELRDIIERWLMLPPDIANINTTTNYKNPFFAMSWNNTVSAMIHHQNFENVIRSYFYVTRVYNIFCCWALLSF